jgi:hypothetical protein
MASTENSPSPMRQLPPKRKSRLYSWGPVVTSLALFIPGGFHYQNNEIFAAVCLFVFSILRTGYQVHVLPTNTSNSSRSLMYDGLFVVSCLLIHLNALYLGVQYRPDITYTIMLCLGLYKSFALLLDISSNKSFTLWNVYILLLLCINIVASNGGTPLSFGSFVKGFFWGGAISHCILVGSTLRAYIKNRMISYALFANMHLAPFKPLHEPLSHLDKAYQDDLD